MKGKAPPTTSHAGHTVLLRNLDQTRNHANFTLWQIESAEGPSGTEYICCRQNELFYTNYTSFSNSATDIIFYGQIQLSFHVRVEERAREREKVRVLSQTNYYQFNTFLSLFLFT
jgi:hypothetical protein